MTQQIDPKSLSASLPFIPIDIDIDIDTNDSAAKKEEQPERTEYYENDFNQDEEEEESLKQTDSKYIYKLIICLQIEFKCFTSIKI